MFDYELRSNMNLVQKRISSMFKAFKDAMGSRPYGDVEATPPEMQRLPVAAPTPIAGSLLASRRFLPLFVTQLLSAFTDNFLKNAVVLLILFGLAGSGGSELVPLAGAIF